jgi:hypothetical protein
MVEKEKRTQTRTRTRVVPNLQDALPTSMADFSNPPRRRLWLPLVATDQDPAPPRNQLPQLLALLDLPVHQLPPAAAPSQLLPAAVPPLP